MTDTWIYPAGTRELAGIHTVQSGQGEVVDIKFEVREWNDHGYVNSTRSLVDSLPADIELSDLLEILFAVGVKRSTDS